MTVAGPDEPGGALAERGRRWPGWLEPLAVVAVFWLLSGGMAPSVNEAHYLGKARHYWDAEYCRGDFFFSSADAHQVFFWTVGLPTRWLSLTLVAWLVRLASWSLLAVGLCRLAATVTDRPGWGLITASLYTVLVPLTQMSGEWVVGGAEAKPIAYGLVFLGLASLAKGDWRAVWLWLGAASAVHVLVGGWATLAVAGSWLFSPGRLPLRRIWPWLVGGGLLSLPGLIPAMLLSQGVDAEIVAEANVIYVFRRLPHHLVFSRFATAEILGHLAAILSSLFLLFWTRGWRHAAIRQIGLVAAAAVLFSAVGIVVDKLGLSDEREAALLRYYWFRLADAIVPLFVSMLLVHLASDSRRYSSKLSCLVTAGIIAGCLASAGWTVVDRIRDSRPSADRQSLVGRQAEYEQWRTVCRWIKQNTPQQAVFLTPVNQQTFKWYAERAEVYNRKDVPQGPREIVEWWRRSRAVLGQRREGYFSMDATQLDKLARRFGAHYVLTQDVSGVRELPLQRIYPVGDGPAVYKVYRLEP